MNPSSITLIFLCFFFNHIIEHVFTSGVRVMIHVSKIKLCNGVTLYLTVLFNGVILMNKIFMNLICVRKLKSISNQVLRIRFH
jgi:hypothetical protein